MNAQEKVRWLDAARPTTAPCALCGNTRGNAVVLQALHWVPAHGYLDLATCGACASAFYPDRDAHVEYPEDASQLQNPEFRLLLHHYLELVSGLEWKIPLLERMPFERFGSVLELGCNMGVALEYCRTAWGADVLGLEPSAYGAGGAELLELPIVQKRLEDADEARGRTFDLAFATEVLEHVDDPHALLADLRARLSPGGMLMITTPRAENVTRDAQPGDLYATLSAGSHRFVPSRAALDRLLERAGFPFRHFVVTGNSQVFYAAPRAFGIRRDVDVAKRRNAHAVKGLERGIANPRVELGVAIHGYDTGVHGGAARTPRALGERVEELLERVFHRSLARPHEIVDAVQSARTIFDLGRAVPYGLPLFLRAHAEVSSARVAAELRALAAVVCAHGLRVDFQNMFAYHWMLDAAVRSAVRSLPSLSASKMLAHVVDVRASVPELATPRDRALSRGLDVVSRFLSR